VLEMQSVGIRKRRDRPGCLIGARCHLVGPGGDTVFEKRRLESQSLGLVMLIAEATRRRTPEAPLLGERMSD